jgi:hypothetical protein
MLVLLSVALVRSVAVPQPEDSMANLERALYYPNIIHPAEVDPKLIDELRTYVKYSGASACATSVINDMSCYICQLFPEEFSQLSNITAQSEAQLATQWYTAVNHKKAEIMVVYRGTSNIYNWITDIEIVSIYDTMPYKWAAGMKGNES